MSGTTTKKRLDVYLPFVDASKLERFCQEDGMSVSELVRRLIQTWLDTRSGSPTLASATVEKAPPALFAPGEWEEDQTVDLFTK